jgi:iturin family lipopeptide synthetase B
MDNGIHQYKQTGLEIAVIGMSGRFPGAKNITEFWENLKKGKESISFFSEQELIESGITPGQLETPNFIRAKSILEGIEYFDADFFGYSPLEAEVMAPQVRLFYECVWHALEDAGYNPDTYNGLIGLYAGAKSSFNWEARSLLSERKSVLGEFAVSTLNDKDYLSSRVSYKLNLKGPCYTVQTACSTSLVAVHLACQGLLGADCDIALVGGVSVEVSARSGYLHQEGMIYSADGHCRTFDARSTGTIFGDGVGIVVLKRYEDALKDNDRIDALVKGSACNNDGIDRIGFTAPGIEGQTAVIQSALRMAEVDPATIGYIEAHGTGTSLGDPIEIEALTRAFNTKRKGFCGIGSVKTNLGHLNTAAGIAGFIKTVLALKHRLIPPSLHFNHPNPEIDFENSPFYVNTTPRQWENKKYPRRAGVSSFGIGGTNAHVVLEECLERIGDQEGTRGLAPSLILLSAKTRSALDRMTDNLAEYLKINPGINLADIAYTLQAGRKVFDYRRMLVCSNGQEVIELLSNHDPGTVRTSLAEEGKKPVIFMFPGQGSQYVNMGLELYRTEPVFRQEMDRCFEILKPLMGCDIKDILYPSAGDHRPNRSYESNIPPIDQTEIAQPLLFAFEYALAKLLMKWGIEPDFMIGHSIGEYAAACLAGVFSLEEALELAALRGQSMQKMPPGAMSSISIEEEELKPLLEAFGNNDISLAAVNTPSRLVVSGTHRAVEDFELQMKFRGYECRALHTSHAFHSKMMEPILERFKNTVKRLQLNKKHLQIPYISNLTGDWITLAQASDPGYWAKHLRQPVRFSDGLARLLKKENAVLIEVGPGHSLSTFVTQHPQKTAAQKVVNMIRHPREKAGDVYFLLSKLGELWLYGKTVDWEKYYAGEKRYRVSLPGYPFERQRYWIDQDPFNIKIEDRMILPGRLDKRTDISQWFYIPQWTRSALRPGDVPSPGRQTGSIVPGTWLVFKDECGLGSALAQGLKEKQGEVVIVQAGPAFGIINEQESQYQINPLHSADYNTLLEELQKRDKLPERVLHLWGVSKDKKNNRGFPAETIERELNTGFYSLLYFVQAIGNRNITHNLRVEVVTDHMQGVTGEEAICPGKAAIPAVVKCISREYPNIDCRSIDIVLPEPQTREHEKLIDRLITEFSSASLDQVVAFRGAHRWVQSFEPMPMTEPSAVPALLKEKGVYMITGGLGGIGLILSQYLVDTVKARLILIGRSDFPSKKHWKKWLDTHDKENPTSQKIRKIQELEKAGGEVLVFSADVTDRKQVQKVVRHSLKHFGRINGIIHGAGLIQTGIIREKTPESIERVLEPKVKGTLILEDLLTGIRPDFVMLCSSLAVVIPPPGRVDYAAANAFLDAYAYYKSIKEDIPVISVNWDVWQGVGMAAGTPGDTMETPEGILPEQGAAAFGRILEYGRGFSQVVVSVRDLNAMLQQVQSAKSPVANDTAESISAGKRYRRPELRSRYTAPRDKLEDLLAAIWQENFGIQQPGVHDNFFELGGDSLKGMKFVDRYSRLLGETVYIDAIFEAPTIAELAVYFREHYPGAVRKLIGTGLDRETRLPARGIDREMIEKISGLLTSMVPRPAEPGEEMKKNPRAIFILSPPRSGSTLLRVMLGGHPRLFAPPELGLLFFNTLDEIDFRQQSLIRAVMQIKECSVEEAKRLVEQFRQQPMTCKQFYRWLQEEIGEQILVDKTPNYAINPGVLERCEQEFDNPLYIHLLRHPYGMIRSYDEAKLDLVRGEKVLKELSISRPEYAELTWFINHRHILEFLKGVPESRQYRLKFEGLVKQPREVTADLCKFLHLDFHPEMLEPYKDKQQRMTDGIYSAGIMIGDMKFHQHREIKPGVADTWKQHFHKDFLSASTWEIAESFGYSRISAEKSKPAPYTQVEPAEKKDYYPLSSGQKRLYVLQTIGSETGYNISNVMVLQGRIDKKELEESFKKLIKRQESFRTSFHLVNEEPVQRIHREVEFEIEEKEQRTEDRRQKTEEKRQTTEKGPGTHLSSVIRHLSSEFIRPFDLTKAPLLRIGLIKADENKYFLVKDMHHIISDGMSLGIITGDFSVLYGNKELGSLSIQYKDYSQWQNSKNRKEYIKKQEEYWTGLYSGDIPVLNLPTDFPRPPIQSFDGNTLDFLIGKEKSGALKEMALEEGVTSFMVILSLFNILLWKLSGQEDIVVGIDIEGRSHAGLHDIIGMFVNALALRNFPDPAKTFKEFLREVKDRTLEAFANQDYPFDELVEKVSVARDASRNPVFDAVFSFMDMKSMAEIPGAIWGRSDLKLEPYPYRNNTAKFDLTLLARERVQGITFSLEYCTKLFQEATIQRFIQYFQHIVSAVIENRNAGISEIKIIPNQEKRQLLFAFNNTKTPLVRDKNYSQLFQEQVIKSSNKTAAIYRHHHITYNTLNNKANQLAHLLRKLGISPNRPVALICERSTEILIGIVGVFKAGGAYIPIEIEMPPARMKQILTDSQTRIILTDTNSLEKSDTLFWQLKSLENCILLDSYNFKTTTEDALFTDIWDFMAESSEEINAYGWNNSYTGEPFTIEEMNQYIHNFKTKLKPYLNPDTRVLEIGCGHGLVLFEIAPQVGYYCAIDPSPAIIEKNKERLQKKKISHVRLESISAAEIDRLKEKDFDVIVCSSVIHYFPETLYLEAVIKKALDLLKSEGIIYLDDIMNLRKKEELIRSTADYKRLNPDAQAKISWEGDLFVDVDFFQLLQEKHPEIVEIETGNKLGVIENELTRFRYDVLLKINKKAVKNKKKSNVHKKRFMLDTLKKFSQGNLNLVTNPEDLSYVIYTSGTSGTPKGVMIHQTGMINHLYAKINDLSITADDRVAQTASVGFDISVWQFLSGLLVGGAVIIIDKEVVLEAVRFLRTLQKEKVTILETVPSLMAVFLDMIGNENDKDLKQLRWMIPTGEPLAVPLVREWFRHYPHIKLVNAYGPTEASDDVTHYKIHEMPPGTRVSIPIGKPLQNLHIYILDKNLSLCPVGVRGEICVSGIGVGKGYWQDPQKTGKAFIRNPYLEEIGDKDYEWLYKTGDVGFFRPDGNIECLGRMDYQVKIRGNRIELGEIESRLLAHERIKEAVVVDRPGPDRDIYLCAYLVTGPVREQQNEITGDALPDSAIREYLAQSLPDYMIPSYFVRLDRIPLTPGGKIDRKSLPDPGEIDSNRDAEYVPPGSEIEKILAAIWEKVLGKSKVGIDENFFLIGGDSIKAIQVVSRVNKAGYKMEMRDIFLNTTIAGLAPKLEKSEYKTDQSVITGIIPLTPIQKEFFTVSRQYLHHYNQAVMLYAKEGFDLETVKAVFTKIQEHHDGLRMTYKVENEKIVQFNHGLEYPLSLQVFDFKSREDALTALEQQANEIQAGIDLEKGPLMKLGLFHLDDGDRLLIVIHHLVMDGVSWRILFEDIETLYDQLKKGEKPVLPAKTDSFKLWAEKLSLYADSQTFLKEKTYWTQLESRLVPGIKKDFEAAGNFVKDNRSSSFTLEEEETALLLTKVNRVYQTEINDILLTALGLGIKKTFGQDRVLLALEGHGREEILEDMETGRTVGWFTSEYPLIMDISYADDPGRQVKEIKETLRRVPNKGIGYGILKYLTNEENKKEIDFKLKPQMSFNYFGQFDADFKQISLFEIAEESAGRNQDPDNQREYELDVSGMITNQRLTMTFYYNETHFEPGTMTALAGHVRSQLKHIIAYCSSKENIEFTPSDFTYKGLSIDSVQGLVEMYPDLEDLYTLTPMQEGMLFHALVDDSSYSYFEQFSYRLQGELDIDLVEKSLNELFKRHDILRSAFVYDDIQRPVQVVLSGRSIDFYYRDISDIQEPGDKENFIKEFKEKDKERGFDLSKDVLMRVSIHRTEQSGYEFTWSFHHILMDGWCVGILNNEFFEIYTAYAANRPYRLPVINPYRTYIQWLDKQDKEASARYWQNYLEAFGEQTHVPKTKLIKGPRGYKNQRLSRVLSGENTSRLTRLAARNHATLNTVTQLVWGILLANYNKKEDVVFGAVVSGRPFELAGVESMVGLFINTIPVRIRFQGKMKFHRLLEKLQEEAIASEPHHYHPLAEIQAATPLKQNLIDHLFLFENYPIAEQIEGYGKENKKNNQSKLEITNLEVFEQTNYDFNIELTGADQLNIRFQYNGNVYDSDEIKRIANHFMLVLDQVMENEKVEIRELTPLSREERNQVLFEFNNTKASLVRDKNYFQLFQEQVSKHPDRIAAIYENQQITYNELNQEADRAAHILSGYGLVPGGIAALYLTRSIEMPVCIIGVFKAGGAYVPLEVDYPPSRIEYILKDSGAQAVITENDNLEILQKIQESSSSSTVKKITILNKSFCRGGQGGQFFQKAPPLADDLAYIIYTSGTTGEPKGVMIHQLGMINHLYAKINDLSINNEDIIAQTASACFDISVWQFLAGLLKGGAVCIIDKEIVLEGRKFLRLLQQRQVTILETVPSLMNAFLEVAAGQTDKRLDQLRWMIPTGEPLTVPLVRAWFRNYPNIKLVNAYGPTEASDDVTHYHVHEIPPETQVSIPIGKPLQNLHIYILDKYLSLCPVGVRGEICVSGIGVGKGYWQDVEKTKKAFIKNPYVEEIGDQDYAWLYKTGDIGYFRPDGHIECLGRMDYQVKIRGNRVELGEIETRLLRHEAIREAVVIDHTSPDGETYLSAYIVVHPFFSAQDAAPTSIKEFLSLHLPDYMIPSYFVQLEKIPLTANGKIDRKALPEPGIKQTGGNIAPRDQLEKKLATMWSEILGIEKNLIGIHTNFFNAGGHSLRAVLLIARIHQELKVKLPLAQVFQTPTIKALAGYIKEAAGDEYANIEPVEKKEYYDLSDAQERLWILDQMEKELIAYNITRYFELEKLDRSTLEKAVETMVKRHEILRTTFITLNGEPKQKIHEYTDLDFIVKYVDLRGEENRMETLKTLIEKEKKTAFNLETGPLLRTRLFHVEENRYLFLYTLHHIISDQWSMDIMNREFISLYEDRGTGKGNSLPPLSIQYKDYTQWHMHQLSGENLKKHQDYWFNRFKGDIPVLDLPTDYPRPRLKSFAGEFIQFSLSSEVAEQFKHIGKESGTTLFITLLAVVKVFLYRYTGQTDIIIGTPFAGREHKDLMNQLGFYVNMLALRNQLKKGQGFRDVLKIVNDNTREALEHHVYPFDRLVHELKAVKDLSRNPLFDVVVAFDNADNQPGNTDNPNTKKQNHDHYLLESGHQDSKHDLRLRFSERGLNIIVHIHYNPQLFKKERIMVIRERFISLITDIVSNGDKKIEDLSFTTRMEKKLPGKKFSGGL